MNHFDLAYRTLADDNNKVFIAVAGNIGCGKTTLTRKLSEKLGWRAHFESVEDNPYLSDFYKDMRTFSVPLEGYFLTHSDKRKLIVKLNSAQRIQDRSIYED